MELSKLIRKYALQNAVSFSGKANPGAVIGKVLGEKPDLKEKIKDIAKEVQAVVKEVNALPVKKQTEELKKLAPKLLEKKKVIPRKELPDLDGAKPGKVVMYEAGDTACENIIMAASKISGTTVIECASGNYMVQEMCFFLQTLGVEITGIGTGTLTIKGMPNIDKNIEYSNSEDPIESMMFISVAIVTDSHLVIERCPIDFLTLELYKLKKMGLKYKVLKKYFSYNGKTKLIDLEILPSILKAPQDKIHANPYPGINIDNLPFFIPIAVKAKGQTLIHDWFYENRAIYATELNRLGANITLLDPHRLYIQGGTPLTSAQIVCPPALRPSMVILISMLGAQGTSILRNVYMISRGYEEIAERLNSLGADIKILK